MTLTSAVLCHESDLGVLSGCRREETTGWMSCDDESNGCHDGVTSQTCWPCSTFQPLLLKLPAFPSMPAAAHTQTRHCVGAPSCSLFVWAHQNFTHLFVAGQWVCYRCGGSRDGGVSEKTFSSKNKLFFFFLNHSVWFFNFDIKKYRGSKWEQKSYASFFLWCLIKNFLLIPALSNSSFNILLSLPEIKQEI